MDQAYKLSYLHVLDANKKINGLHVHVKFLSNLFDLEQILYPKFFLPINEKKNILEISYIHDHPQIKIVFKLFIWCCLKSVFQNSSEKWLLKTVL